ncbi:MAG: hypothetical protein ACM3JI_04830, partial [Anaerolineae bacterium]
YGGNTVWDLASVGAQSVSKPDTEEKKEKEKTTPGNLQNQVDQGKSPNASFKDYKKLFCQFEAI